MIPALRAVSSRGKAHIALLSPRALVGSLRCVFPHSTSSSGYHSCVAPPQHLHSHLHRLSQLQASLSAPPISLRGYSTVEDDSRCETVSPGDDILSERIVEHENVASALDVSTQEACVGTLDANESVDDELSDVEDAISTVEISDSDTENCKAGETGDDVAGSISGDDEMEPEVVGSNFEHDDTNVPSGNDSGEEEGDSEDEQGEDTGSISGDNVLSSNDSGAWVKSIDISDLPDGLKEVLEDDDSFDSESAEEEVAAEGDVQLLTLEEVKEVLENVRARDIQIFPVHNHCEWTDLMVLATGISDRHVRGIADALVYKIKKKSHIDSTHYPTVEGQVGGKWLVVDCGDIVIHVLDEESRAYYKLEDLWSGDIRPGTADEDLKRMLKNAGLKEAR